MPKTKTFLVVDDDMDDTFLFKEVLTEVDPTIQLMIANDGEEALMKLRTPERTLPDIIFLDLNMPKMNGIEFLKIIKNIELYKDIDVFIMTTSGEEADRRTAEELGICGYLMKPLNFNNNDKRTDSLDAFFQFHLRKILAN